MTASGKKISLVLCAMLLLTGMVAISHAAQPVSPDLDLEHKRTKLAMRWLEPEPHMALAKLISDRRDRLLAFYILENIRRTGFPKEVFDQAFDQVFRERDAFDNSPEAEAVALAAVKAALTEPSALILLADIYISRENYAAAASLLERVIEVQPDEPGPWFALSETYRRQGRAEDATRRSEFSSMLVTRPPFSGHRFATDGFLDRLAYAIAIAAASATQGLGSRAMARDSRHLRQDMRDDAHRAVPTAM